VLDRWVLGYAAIDKKGSGSIKKGREAPVPELGFVPFLLK